MSKYRKPEIQWDSSSGGATQKQLREGHTNQNLDDQPYDGMEGYSEPLSDTQYGGFVKRKNYRDRH